MNNKYLLYIFNLQTQFSLFMSFHRRLALLYLYDLFKKLSDDCNALTFDALKI